MCMVILALLQLAVLRALLAPTQSQVEPMVV